DVSLARAQADMTVLGERLAAEAAGNAGWTVSIVPLSQQITGDVRAAFGVLLAAVALLLSIAIANVATLTMTQMRRRRHELATRRSLGASDGRLFRQLFTQSALLGLAATVVGLLAVSLALGVMATLMARSFATLRAVDLGFTGDGVVAARISLAATRAEAPANSSASFQAVLERVRALPGVQSAGLISIRPFGGPGP